MKKLLILPLLVLLTGCVTYYYPETALEDGVYYAEDDPSYVVYSDPYAGVAYYPWASLDYFYLGYDAYPAWRVDYGYFSGFSVGVGYGYSPWYYPYRYHNYYSPWYVSHNYHYYPGWQRYRGYCSNPHGCGHHNKKSRRGDRHDRYANDGNRNRDYDRYNRSDRDRSDRDRSDRDRADNRHVSGRRVQPNADSNNSAVRRYVSTAPAGYSNDRGMVIRSKESKKIGKSHLGNLDPIQSVNVTSSVSSAANPDYSTKRAANEVRYRSGSKQSRSRTEPVASISRNVQISSVPRAEVKATGNAVKSGQTAGKSTKRNVAARPSGNSNSRPPAKTRSQASANNSKGSRSNPGSSNRSSKNSGSSRREDRR